MKLTKENSALVDDFLNEMVKHFDAGKGSSFTISEYQQIGQNGFTLYEDIYHALIIADYKQKKLGFNVFQMVIRNDKPSIDYQNSFTDAFLAAGGFSAIWEDEERERTDRFSINQSVTETNSSTRATNRISRGATIAQRHFTEVIMWATICTALIAGLSLLKDFGYNQKRQPDKIEVVLKSPQVLPIVVKDTCLPHPSAYRKNVFVPTK